MGFLDRFRQPTTYTTPAEGDQLIVQRLRRLGVDVSQPREVVHFVYFPTREDAEDAASELREKGYTVEVEPSADAETNPPNPWLALARRDAVVDEASVAAMRPRFEALAAARSGEYDGWEAAAV